MTDSAQHERVGAGPVERAVRAYIAVGTRLPTPTGRATFIVDDFSQHGMVLLIGAKRPVLPARVDDDADGNGRADQAVSERCSESHRR